MMKSERDPLNAQHAQHRPKPWFDETFVPLGIVDVYMYMRKLFVHYIRGETVYMYLGKRVSLVKGAYGVGHELDQADLPCLSSAAPTTPQKQARPL